jgi:hypothetical protein
MRQICTGRSIIYSRNSKIHQKSSLHSFQPPDGSFERPHQAIFFRKKAEIDVNSIFGEFLKYGSKFLNTLYNENTSFQKRSSLENKSPLDKVSPLDEVSIGQMSIG